MLLRAGISFILDLCRHLKQKCWRQAFQFVLVIAIPPKAEEEETTDEDEQLKKDLKRLART